MERDGGMRKVEADGECGQRSPIIKLSVIECTRTVR